MEIFYLLAFSAFNSGHYEDCQKIFNYLLLLEENNYVVKYYQRQLQPYLQNPQQKKEKAWDYYPQIPLSVWRKRIEALNTRQDFYGVWHDETFMEYINWAVDTIDDPELHTRLAEKLSQTDKKTSSKYLKNLLLNQNLTSYAKGNVIYYLLLQGSRGRIYMVRDGYFSYIDVPKNIPHILSNAVLLCISRLSTLFMLDSKYPSIVVKIAKNMQTKILDNGLTCDFEEKVLASVIARNCNFEWLDDKKIIESFGVSYKEMTELNDFIYNSEI